MAFKRTEHYLDLIPLEGHRIGEIIYPSIHRLLVNTLSGEFKKDHRHRLAQINVICSTLSLNFSTCCSLTFQLSVMICSSIMG